MILYLILLMITTPSAAHDYEPALRTAATAAFKQSGLEADYLQVQSSALNKGNQWANKNGLKEAVLVTSFVAPILVYKKIEIRSNGFTFIGNKDKLEGQFNLPF